MAGKLIVLDGTDASGKQTQAAAIEKILKERGENVLKVTFPNYEEAYAAPVRMYLAGEFGDKPGDVNPYAASIFYAVDRICSFKNKWQAFYEAGGIIIADRYTTSNAIHQGSKLEEDRREAFFAWLYDFEFDKIGLPKPDCVLFLDMPPSVSQKLMANRLNKATGQKEKDIHEKDTRYLEMCYRAANCAAKFYGWEKIACTDAAGEVRKAEDITVEVMQTIDKYL